MRNSLLILWTMLVLLSSGCANQNRMPSQPEEFRELFAKEQSWYKALAKTLKRDIKEIDQLVDKIEKAAPCGPDQLNDSQDKYLKYLRRELAARLMMLVDDYHDRTKNTAYVAQKSAHVFADLTALASAAAATVVGAAGTKTVLAGISTAVQGVNSSIDENYLEKQAISSVLNQIEINRVRKRTEIEAMLNAKPFIDYGLASLERDVLEYFNSGSLVNGLTTMSDSQRDRATVANSNLENVRAGRLGYWDKPAEPTK
jgi:hypothetical protein